MQLYLLLLVTAIISSECHKILVYIPQMGYSHMTFLGHLADRLVKAGHDVVALTPTFDSLLTTNGTKLARIIRYETNMTTPIGPLALRENAWTERGESVVGVYNMINRIASIQQFVCKAMLADEKLLKQLKAEKFDLGISEVISSCGFAIFDKINLEKFVGSFATNLLPSVTRQFGIDHNPSYIPETFAPCTDTMNYFERAKNLLSTAITFVIGRYIERTIINQAYKDSFPLNYNVKDTIAKSTFLFVNADEYIEFPRCITHKVVYVGGIAVDKAKPLEHEFKEVMDKAVGGAVLVSFGSIAQSSKMTPAMRNAFVRMFTAFPHIQFIWKYEVEDEVANDRPNVLKTKWVPQNDLLAHPNMKAFISHGGMNSLTEAFQHGVPIVCIPLFGDQMRNAKMAEKRRVATFLDKGNITETSLLWALRTVLSDKSYAKHSKRLARMIAKKPFSSEEVFLRHIEFAAEFGHVDNLDSAAAQLNFLQYYMIDIIVPFIASVLLTAYIGVRMVMRICCSFMRVAKSKTE